MCDQVFKKGTYVEVKSDEEGFRGAWYTAKIIESPTMDEFVMVEYKDFVTEEDEHKKLCDRVHVSYVRPLAPAGSVKEVIKVNDGVDAFVKDGWWSGVVHEDLGGAGEVFLVYFDDPPHKMVFDRSDLRLHFDWVGGKWEQPRNKVIPHTMNPVKNEGAGKEAQSVHTPPTLCESQSISHQTPRSIPIQTVGFFKQLRDMLQGDKFDQILPPRIHLDEQTICCYEHVLKNGLSGDLRDLGKDSRYQEFNEALTGLLACRRIPLNLHKGFLSLRHDLPSLANRAFELNKEVTQAIVQRDTRSTVKVLESYINEYRNCEDHLLKLEQEKEFNLLEIGRLQARNQAIECEVTKFLAEIDELQKASAAQSHKIANPNVSTLDESTLRQSMDDLSKLENEWKNRVAVLQF